MPRAGRLVPIRRTGIVPPRLAAVGRLVLLRFTFWPPLPTIDIQSVGFSDVCCDRADLVLLFDSSTFPGSVVEFHSAGWYRLSSQPTDTTTKHKTKDKNKKLNDCIGNELKGICQKLATLPR